jgi:hypothetical protein
MPFARFCSRTWASLAGAAVLLPALSAAPSSQSTGFVPLLDGTSLAGWVVENTTSNNFSVRGGVIRVEGPQGWLRSVDQYADFDLGVEFRFLTDDADSGVFVRAPGPASNVFMRGWPANAYQVQTRDISRNRTTNPIWIGNLYRHRVPPGETTYDAGAALGAFKPTGEWQRFDITLAGDRITVRLNGTQTTQASGIVNPRGHIGLQGEAGIVEYRVVEVRVK